MEALSFIDKLVIKSFSILNWPVHFTRLTRLIYLAELRHKLTYSESFKLTWVIEKGMYKCIELSASFDKLERLGILEKTMSNYRLKGDMNVTIPSDIKHTLSAYLTSYYIKCHPRYIDKEQKDLISKASFIILDI